MEEQRSYRLRWFFGITVSALLLISVCARAVMQGPRPPSAASAQRESAPRESAGGDASAQVRSKPEAGRPLGDAGKTGILPGEPRVAPPPQGGATTPGTATEEGEGDEVSETLPFVSEASFFGLLGFALGFATRAVLKIALLAVAVYFLSLQGLSALDVIDIHWGRAAELMNDFVLNLKENRTLGDVLRDRIPTAGTLLVGYLIGLRRG